MGLSWQRQMVWTEEAWRNSFALLILQFLLNFKRGEE
jgi:hypothetical protein